MNRDSTCPESDRNISVILINWFSGEFLSELVPNLRKRAFDPSQLHFIVVDNTGGKDPEMDRLRKTLDIDELITNTPPYSNGSEAHACGIEAGFTSVNSPYTLILDPDVHVFQTDWDSCLVQALEDNNAAAIGAPYPAWKLGKYHNFPSPIFCFARTQALRDLGADWTPFYPGRVQKYRAWFGRQIVRLGALNTRQRCIRHPALLHIGSWLERRLGVVGPDTGQLLAQCARRSNISSLQFKDIYPTDPVYSGAGNEVVQKLAENFELYAWDGSVFLAHMGGTKHYMFHTPQGYNRTYWVECIASALARTKVSA